MDRSDSVAALSEIYKKTLNLSQTAFPIRGGGSSEDEELLGRWEQEGLAQRLMHLHEGSESFILHDGPPYANGDIHIGHAYNKLVKDIITKSKRMAGKHVPVIPGWDCHGLPIEHKVISENPAMRTDPVAVKRACRSYAAHWIKRQMDAFRRLGVMMDWEHPYITMSYAYEAGSLRVLQRLVEAGFIRRKFKTVAWCFHCETTLASAEIEYHERKDPSVYVAFPVKKWGSGGAGRAGDLSFLVWTTTPWTLPLNRALAIHASRYEIIEIKNRRYIVGAERVAHIEQVFAPEAIIRCGFVESKDLHGAEAEHPFIPGLTVPVYYGEHVSLSEGTGIVHTAPGCGPDDYEFGVKKGLEVYAPITPDGRYDASIIPVSLAGVSVSEAHGKVIQLLQECGNLVHKGSIRHSYPHCWRCRNGLIYRATEQWFFELTCTREGAVETVQQSAITQSDHIHFSPQQGASFLRASVEHRWEWCLSRQRMWGIPIPALVCGTCNRATLNSRIIAYVAAAVEKSGIEVWDTLSVDEVAAGSVCEGCGGCDWRKERDILDVWFDSGVSHAVVLDTHRYGQRYPADLYVEGLDQYRGWFQSSLLTALALRNDPPMRAILSHGFTVDDKGRKMSKSLGNVVHPQELLDRLGTDGVRLWVASIDHGGDVVVAESLLKNVEQVYLKIRNSCRFMLQNMGTFQASERLSFDELLLWDRIALIHWATLYTSMVNAYETYDTTGVFHGIGDACASFLSAWYFDSIKDRIYTDLPASRERRSAQTVLWCILDSLVRLMAPILSFTMERVAEHYYPSWGRDSVHMQTFPDIFFFGVTADMLAEHALYRREYHLLLRMREGVMRLMEKARQNGLFKHSRQAALRMWYTTASSEGKLFAELIAHAAQLGESHESLLAEMYVVAQVVVTLDECMSVSGDACEIMPGVYVEVVAASGERCMRCWRWRTLDGVTSLCERCAIVVATLRDTTEQSV